MSDKDIKMDEVSEKEIVDAPIETQSAAPGEYEYLEPEKMKDPTPPPTEEDQQLQAMSAIEEIPSLLQKLEDDNTQYEVHVQLISALKLAEMPEQLEEARENMHAIYPLTENLWLDWINDAKKEADTTEGELKLRKLYKEAENDYLSIPIWKSFVDFVLEKFYTVFGDNDTGIKEESDEINTLIALTRHDLVAAVSSVTYHIKSSQDIWRPFAQFELALLERFKDDQQKERLENVYLERLRVMHLDCDETFSLYSSFISAWKSDTNYEDTMVRANKIYSKTKAEAEKRDWYEMQLVNTGYALDTFYQYIEKEKEFKPQLNYIRSLYERAIAVYCTDQVLWNDYILYLTEKAHVISFLKALAMRSIRNCPWSGTMRAHLARFMESNNEERDDIIDVFDDAVQNKLLLSSMEDLITILLAKCDYERRQIDWSDPDEEQVLNLQVAFHEALQYMDEAFPGQTDPYYRIEKYFAFIHDKRLGNTDDARTLWESIIKKHGKDTEAYIQYIYFERDHGDYEKCAFLFKLALQKRVDNPARLMDVWSTIEREGGTVSSMEECLIRSNRVSKFLQNKWQVEAIKQEEHAERDRKRKEEEVKRKEEEKRKKGLRRMEAKKKIQVKKAQNKQTNADDSMDTESGTKEIKAEPEETKEGSEEPEEPVQENSEQTSTGLKRKASSDLAGLEKKQRNASPSDEDTKPEMDGEFRRPELPFRPARGSRGTLNARSKRLGRGGRGGMFAKPRVEKTQDDKTEQSVNTEKSNDDFRSMLLGKK